MTRLRQWVEVAGVEVALAVARVLPRRALLALGGVAGALAGRIDRRHTAIARENLRAAYGDAMDAAERERVLRACWRHFGRITFDALTYPSLDGAALDAILEVDGIDNLRNAMAEGRGALVFAAHHGNWEAGAYATARSGCPSEIIVRPLDNPLLDRRLVELRRRAGNAVIPKRRAVRESLRALGRGACVAILIDQDAGADSVFVPFFGRLAATTPTLALLALRTEAPILPMFTRVKADGTIFVHVGPVIPSRPSGDREEDVRRLTAECTALVEHWTRRSPEQWLWMHRRWKTRPPGETAAGA
jgi:KDO2-lipid IV(A) lauroyltransferase